MNTTKKVLGKLTTISLLLLITLVYACQTSTDPEPEPEPPVLPDGERVMLIEVSDQDENALTGYNIDISGPTSTSASNVSESVFTFDNLADGEYTIVVTRDDYVEGKITIEVELPEERTAEVTFEELVILVEKPEPVVISNNQDNVVETAPSDDPEAQEDEKVVMNIPANSIPADALDENGNISIRVTRSTPNEVTEGEGGGTVTDNFSLEPSGLVLNNEIEMDIPINAIPGVTYVLQPGNIPMTAVASKTTGQQTTGSQANQSTRTVTKFRVKLSEFGEYSVNADITLERTNVEFPEPFQVAEGACAQNLTFTYEMPHIVNGNLNTIPEQARKLVPRSILALENDSKSYSKSKTNTSSDFFLRALGQTMSLRYRTIQNSEVIEEFTLNARTRFDFISVECHNSGG